MASHSAVIWEFFTISKSDESKASCNYCSKLISRGGQDKSSFGHSGLKKHLLTHTRVFAEFEKKQTDHTSQKKKQCLRIEIKL